MKSGYCTIMWTARDCGTSYKNPYQPHQRPIFIQRRLWCCVYGGIGRESSITTFFWKTRYLIPTSTAPNEPNWRQQLDENHPELLKRKCIIFHQDTTRCIFLWWPGKSCYSLAEKFWFIHCIHQTLHLWCPFILVFTKFSSWEKQNYNSLEGCKRHQQQSFAQKDKKFWEDGVMKLPEKWQKVVEQNNKYVIQ